MAFKIGDTVTHPNYGAGIITDIRERQFLDVERKRYYTIQLLGQPETTVMVALQNAEEIGLRPTVSRSRLSRIMRTLGSQPNELPSDHNKRYEVLKDKLYSGSAIQIADVLRDLAWRREQRKKLTARGKRLYDRGMELLAGEIAGARHSEIDAAEYQITRTLEQNVSPSPAM
jgi:CarD family transcriptional regulator